MVDRPAPVTFAVDEEDEDRVDEDEEADEDGRCRGRDRLRELRRLRAVLLEEGHHLAGGRERVAEAIHAGGVAPGDDTDERVLRAVRFEDTPRERCRTADEGHHAERQRNDDRQEQHEHHERGGALTTVHARGEAHEERAREEGDPCSEDERRPERQECDRCSDEERERHPAERLFLHPLHLTTFRGAGDCPRAGRP